MFLLFHDSGECFFLPILLAFHIISFVFFFRTIYIVLKRKSKIAVVFGITATSAAILLLTIYNIFHDFVSASLLPILIYPFGFLWAFFGGALFLDATLNGFEPQGYDFAIFDGNLNPNISFILAIINIYFAMNVIEIAERKLKQKNLT